MKFKALLIGVLLLNIAIAIMPSTKGETFDPNIRVNNNLTDQRNVPVMTVAWDGTVYAAWQDKSTGNWRIMLANAPASGGSFGGHMSVASSPPPGSIEQSPDIGYWNETVHIVWQDNRNTGSNDIFYSSLPKVASAPLPERKINDERWQGYRSGPAMAVAPTALSMWRM